MHAAATHASQLIRCRKLKVAYTAMPMDTVSITIATECTKMARASYSGWPYLCT